MKISCKRTRVAPSVTALRIEVKEVNIFKNFTVSRKLKFDYLDWVSTLRRSKKPSPAFPEKCSPDPRVFIWTVLIICNCYELDIQRSEKRIFFAK